MTKDKSIMELHNLVENESKFTFYIQEKRAIEINNLVKCGIICVFDLI